MALSNRAISLNSRFDKKKVRKCLPLSGSKNKVFSDGVRLPQLYLTRITCNSSVKPYITFDLKKKKKSDFI